jgi:rhombotail lipoprotein
MEATPSKSQTVRIIAIIALLVLLVFALTGCISPRHTQHHRSSSVLQFLYPGDAQPYVAPHIPTLRLPLRVGVAFAPSKGSNNMGTENFSEAQKSELLRTVSRQFESLPFVASIQIIPSTYLRPGGGFENLDQLRHMMGIDVIALIAYDQAQATSETDWSFAYWTIIGAYIVPASKNETHTLMEAVVYDIESRSLLFRAPGTSAVKDHSTLAAGVTSMRASSSSGFEKAAADLTVNLQSELDLFKVRAKEEPDSVKIAHRPGYTGAGSLEGWLGGSLILLLLPLVLPPGRIRSCFSRPAHRSSR